ncbi:hypothetical protein [Marimonas arenosa]|uniref:Uncharacterized protein n=1 Tax=Marimonas arenosa TaxID=1795305 RepID=A0AAE3WE06_9RHOB|nr:hypothetical protein [Marimonas arenosa]MDQ2090675.1 hypothetical protein [Marimonas arenosa]
MTADKLRISEIRFNPERAGFEALVTVHDGRHSFRYPAFVAAPVHAEYRLVARGLTERALAAHRAGKHGLRAWLRPLTAARPVQPELPPLAA